MRGCVSSGQAEATAVQAVDDHLDAIYEALDDIEQRGDGPGRRVAQLRGQIEAMEDHSEPSFRDGLRQARASLRADGHLLDR